MASEKFPSFNFFPTDWIGGTAELTAEQKGCFIDLLAYSWEQTPPCTLPNDPSALARLAGMSGAKWRVIGGAILKKFEAIDGGRIRNPKLWEVYLSMCENRNRRKFAGQQGGNAKAMLKQSPSNRVASHSVEASKDASSITVDPHFEKFWQCYPKRAGSNPKRDALIAFRTRIREGATVEEIMAGLARYVAFSGAAENIGTQFIMQAKRFVGPSKPYAEEWAIPADSKKRPQKFDYSNPSTEFKGFTA